MPKSIAERIEAMVENRMYGPGDVELTANRGDEEPWRVERLARVMGYTSALCDGARKKQVFRYVAGLHDHKGRLTVRWLKRPDAWQRRCFVRAWESVIGDGCDQVEHEMAPATPGSSPPEDLAQVTRGGD